MSFQNINTLNQEKLLLARALYDADIFCYVETRQSESKMQDLVLEGYESFSKSRNPHSLGANRIYGGVAAYIRRAISQGVKPVNSDITDVLWLQFSSKFFNLDRDIFLGIIYLPPYQSPWYNQIGSDIFDELSQEIQKLARQGAILLAGDFNAKTRNETGLFPPPIIDPYEPFIPIVKSETNFTRVSKDTNPIDTFGRSLLDLCSNLNLIILNGGFGSDKNVGNFTFQRKLYTGAVQESVIDYMIASLDILPSISDFEILPHPEKISDHHSLILELGIGLDTSKPCQMQHSIQPKLPWKPQFQSYYQTRLTNFWVYNATLFNRTLDEDYDDNDTKTNKAIELILQSIRDSTYHQPQEQVGKIKNRHENPPWWNRRCQILYDDYSSAVHKCRHLNSPVNRATRKRKHTEFTKYFRKRRKHHFKQINEKLSNLSSRNPKSFWRLFKTQRQHELTIEPSALVSHYRCLFQPNFPLLAESTLLREVDIFTDEDHSVDILDTDISTAECQKALKRLSNGKAPGLDGIPYEFLKSGGPILAPLLTRLFNHILHSGCYPKAWARVTICSIHKSGDKNDPGNYRGISLLPSLSKLFDIILDTRLRIWETTYAVLDQNQAGFRAKFSTVDHIFTLNTIILRYRSESRKVYCAFIDFSKAFDSVNRAVLYYKLCKEGVSSKFIRLMRSLYSQTMACIKGYESEFFEIMSGVQQGAPLSPCLFALVLNDLDKELRSNNTGYVSLQNLKIHSLLFADDLVLPSETPEGLLQSLDVLYEFSQKWGLKINANKSNIMIFRNSGRFLDNTVWRLGRSDQVLKVVDQYKYLGVWFKTTGLSQFTLMKRAELGNRAKFSLFNSLKSINSDPKLTLRLFDTLVSSVLFYGVEVWGYLKLKNHIELVHTSFLRQFLRVRKSTPLLALYGETGRLPLFYFAALRMLRFWSKLMSLPENRYVKVAYNDAMQLYYTNPDYSPWCSFVAKTLKQLSMYGYFEFQSIPNPNEFYKLARNRIFVKYKKDWCSETRALSSLDNYIKFKSSHGLEQYLAMGIDARYLSALCRFRLRSHNLAIEVGRHRSIPRERRLCVYCDSDLIEDEVHFLLFCSYYDELRRPLIPYICDLNTNDAFAFLLNSTVPTIIRLVAKFIYQAFLKRSNYNIFHE
jgi:hypothetical protein